MNQARAAESLRLRQATPRLCKSFFSVENQNH